MKSPTADPVITLTLAVMVLGLTHYYAIKMKGAKGYFKAYKPNDTCRGIYKLLDTWSASIW